MHTEKKEAMSKYELRKDGSFIIKDYNSSPSFSSFLPGIAGKYGIPLWCFYVNRGQCVSSFGVEGKGKSILEFLPANQAYAYTYERGFRTFIKIGERFFEPFGLDSASNAQVMRISSDLLVIEDMDKKSGLKIQVKYFTLPQENFSALVREITIENTSDSDLEIEMADGLPQIVPYGTNNWFLKKMSRTIEAWMDTSIKNDISLFRLRVSAEDVAETTFIEGANFFLCVDISGSNPKPLKPVLDSAVLFNEDTGYCRPHRFISKDFKYSDKQTLTGKTPSAFGYAKKKIAAGRNAVFCSLYGAVEHESLLVGLVDKLHASYVEFKEHQNKEIIDGITSRVECSSASDVFDGYVKQNFLDNVLRGGLPETFGGSAFYYLYSRKHGDIERDYNQFYLSPTYLSAGNGNFRDVNQNRRCDVLVNPDVERNNIYMFYNLQRPDGYNPLVVKPSLYRFEDGENVESVLADIVDKKVLAGLKKNVGEEFDVGTLVVQASHAGLPEKQVEKVVEKLLSGSYPVESADFGEGFWVDHWTYNLDLVEVYLSVYPDKEEDLFFEKVYSFYDDAHKVNPRSVRYYLKNKKVYQGNFLFKDPEREKEIAARKRMKNRVRYKGTDEIVYACLLSKMLALVCNKVSTLDPFGRGIEMEAGKPGWCDALNGLPALFGSSTAETYELKRMCLFLDKKLGRFSQRRVELPRELFDFYWGLKGRLAEKLNSFEFWATTNRLKEEYRDLVHNGFSSGDVAVSVEEIHAFIKGVIKRIDKGLKAVEEGPTVPCFFTASLDKYDVIDGVIDARKFSQRALPLFLEGFVRAYKTMDKENVAARHKSLEATELFDKKLKMYKINESLESEPYEIGRNRVFKPGWLENESIWLHMEYKYVLELLKAGCMDEFYKAVHNVFVCFLDPAMYGRSILENSSFIASSAYVNKDVWGRGFVARLSGSTIEAMHIYFIMVMGSSPFKCGDQGLYLEFEPKLKAELFKENDNTFSFTFLGRTKVTYHNPARVDTYSSKAKVDKIVIGFKDGKKKEVTGAVINEPECLLIRNRQAETIDIYYA